MNMWYLLLIMFLAGMSVGLVIGFAISHSGFKMKERQP